MSFFLSCRSLSLSLSLSLLLSLSLSVQYVKEPSSQHLELGFLRILRFLRRREGQNRYLFLKSSFTTRPLL